MLFLKARAKKRRFTHTDITVTGPDYTKKSCDTFFFFFDCSSWQLRLFLTKHLQNVDLLTLIVAESYSSLPKLGVKAIGPLALNRQTVEPITSKLHLPIPLQMSPTDPFPRGNRRYAHFAHQQTEDSNDSSLQRGVHK